MKQFDPIREKIWRYFGLYFLFLFFILFNCHRRTNPVSQSEIARIESSYILQAAIQTWKDGKKAAYTIEFDDARESHYLLSWPELEKRKIRATFNINVPGNLNWRPWRHLASEGNEIASHTITHPDLTKLTPAQIEDELRESLLSIWQEIGKKPVSFTNPYGTSNAEIEKLISKYYLSARNRYGMNSAHIKRDDLFHLKAIGVYRPLSFDFLNRKIEEAIQNNRYLIVTFHSLTEGKVMPNQTFLPLSLLQQHLDDVVKHAASLWVAPRCEVIKYIQLRQNSRLHAWQNNSEIVCQLKSGLNRKRFDVPLTIKLNMPENWRKRKIVSIIDNNVVYHSYSQVDSLLFFDAPANSTVRLIALE